MWMHHLYLPRLPEVGSNKCGYITPSFWKQAPCLHNPCLPHSPNT